MLDRQSFEAIVQSASRAPSVHNTQPARFRLVQGNIIEVYGEHSALLPVCDPSGKDHFVSLGAAVEGLRLALNARGFGYSWEFLLESLKDIDRNKSRHLAARVHIESSSPARDEFAALTDRRQSYRGIFQPANAEQIRSLVKDLETFGQVSVFTKAEDLRRIAILYDDANSRFLMNSEFNQEMYEWLRLSPSHPSYERDGLNAEGLQLSGLERLAASFLMQPRVLTQLMRTGMGRALLAEEKKIRSATMIVVLLASKAEHPMARGMRFYRLWLILTMYGLAACPLSSLIDDASTATRLFDLMQSNHKGLDCVGAWDCGIAPAQTKKASPRLPIKELILEE